MAKIYINCGKYDEAIDELDYLLSLRAVNTANSLKLQSWVDPLRDHPRFQALIDKYEKDNGT
jgi:hypothetical protein